MKTKIEIKNLKNFIIECIRLNDILYNKIIKKRFENSREKFNIYAKKKFCKKHSHSKNKVKFYVDIVLIKLNVIIRRKKTNFKKNEIILINQRVLNVISWIITLKIVN